MLTEILPEPIKTLPPVKPKEPNWPKNYPPKEFDWLTELQELVNGKPYSPQEYENLRYRAGMWPTCACGQLCRSLLRTHPEGRPVDDILFTYGRAFYAAIKEMNWNSALHLFNMIETRTQHLLNEQRIILDSLQSRR